MWAMFYEWPKIPRNSLFEKYYVVRGHLVFLTLIHFKYINTYDVCGTNLRPNFFKNVPYESFNYFFLETKSLMFFQDLVGILKLVQI